jgi:hypothetical protein
MNLDTEPEGLPAIKAWLTGQGATPHFTKRIRSKDQGRATKCWVHMNAPTEAGYVQAGTPPKLTHRTTKALEVQRALSSTEQVHHECLKKNCCNPWHLSIVDRHAHDEEKRKQKAIQASLGTVFKELGKKPFEQTEDILKTLIPQWIEGIQNWTEKEVTCADFSVRDEWAGNPLAFGMTRAE